MLKLDERQRKRMQELDKRSKDINEVVLERIQDYHAPLPLNLVLEARFNAVQKKGIELEAEIDHIMASEEMDEGVLKVKTRRLDMIRGQLNELQNIGEMLKQYDMLGREFEIVRY
ncbi:MAG TPA: hypothetical protein VFF20_08300 [Pseudogracilibacillus sp.]|nr:hypothetical protein [Pseudogracilibacillus sp.]